MPFIIHLGTATLFPPDRSFNRLRSTEVSLGSPSEAGVTATEVGVTDMTAVVLLCQICRGMSNVGDGCRQHHKPKSGGRFACFKNAALWHQPTQICVPTDACGQQKALEINLESQRKMGEFLIPHAGKSCTAETDATRTTQVRNWRRPSNKGPSGGSYNASSTD